MGSARQRPLTVAALLALMALVLSLAPVPARSASTTASQPHQAAEPGRRAAFNPLQAPETPPLQNAATSVLNIEATAKGKVQK